MNQTESRHTYTGNIIEGTQNEMGQEQERQNKIIIKKMIFLYQALLDGWTIRMINNKEFEFKRSKDNQEEK